MGREMKEGEGALHWQRRIVRGGETGEWSGEGNGQGMDKLVMT